MTFLQSVRTAILSLGIVALSSCAVNPDAPSESPDISEEITGQTRQDLTIAGDSWWEIHLAALVAGGGCIDQFAFGTTTNTPVVIWSCNGLANQRWFFDSSQHIRGLGLNLCLFSHTITENRMAPCDDPNLNSTGLNHFAVVSDSQGNRAIKLLFNNTCLAARPDGGFQWVFPFFPGTCASSDGVIPFQSRIYLSDPNPIVGGVRTMGSRCMDVANGNPADGTQVWMWDCSPSGTNGAQIWSNGPGNTIRNANGKCLAATGTANGSGIVIQTCNGSPSQQWTVDEAAGNTVIRNNNAGRCLDVGGWSLANGATLMLWDCNPFGGPVMHQSWDVWLN